MFWNILMWTYERKLVKPLFNVLTFVAGLYCYGKAKDLHAAGEPWLSRPLFGLLGFVVLLWILSYMSRQVVQGKLSRLRFIMLGVAALVMFLGASYASGLYGAFVTSTVDALFMALYLTNIVIVGGWDAQLAYNTSTGEVPAWLWKKVVQASEAHEMPAGPTSSDSTDLAQSPPIDAELVDEPEPVVYPGRPTFRGVPTTLYSGE